MNIQNMKTWSYEELVQNTGLNKGSVYALVSKKQIPHIRLGKKWVRFIPKEVLKWLEGRRQK